MNSVGVVVAGGERLGVFSCDLIAAAAIVPPIGDPQYTNAKIVLVGDSGVGKSGLALVLSDQEFVATESSHGRNIWMMESKQVKLTDGRDELREALIWDLAGQPGYRIVHQLHLDEVAVAVVVFDARSETDPFAGVQHWDRALKLAQRRASGGLPMKKYLVAARIDRGGVGASKERIETVAREMGCDGYFETSAKEGWGIPELMEKLRAAIDWDNLPKVNSTKLFQQIKEFLIKEKETGRLLCTADALYRAFVKNTGGTPMLPTDELPAQFDTCIGRVESRGLIRRLSFGGLVLLQPEMLDAYAAALVNAAKSEPDGLGCITEEDARFGRFAMSKDERIADPEQEKLLLIATVEDLLAHELALRDSTDHGAQLVFPSQFTKDNPDLPNPKGQTTILTFEGPVVNIYATLAVRLSHSGLFKKERMWRNAAEYTASVGGVCGIWLRERDEGRGEMTLFFTTEASAETRHHFEEYVQTHLIRRALPETVTRRRIHVCPECNGIITDEQAAERRSRGFDWARCPGCDTKISLTEGPERVAEATAEVVRQMDAAADAERDRAVAMSKLEGKIKTNDFDVFLCHNSQDKPAVKEIGERLKERGILPWLDEWNLEAGTIWQDEIEKVLGRIKSAAVFLGSNGKGVWHEKEIRAITRRSTVGADGISIIPVILSGVEGDPDMPVWLKDYMWVDFRKEEPDPMERLARGIARQDRFDLP
jgi:GTPase SAR1 family protein